MEPATPPDCLYYLISRTTLVATTMLKKALAEAGVGHVRPAYLGALLTLWNDDELQSSELARRAGLEPSTTTGLVDRMERDGLITRRADPGDRRASRICLTAEGRDIHEKVLAVVDQTLARATKGLAKKDITTTKRVLTSFLKKAADQTRVDRTDKA